MEKLLLLSILILSLFGCAPSEQETSNTCYNDGKMKSIKTATKLGLLRNIPILADEYYCPEINAALAGSVLDCAFRSAFSFNEVKEYYKPLFEKEGYHFVAYNDAGEATYKKGRTNRYIKREDNCLYDYTIRQNEDPMLDHLFD
jgi:hypothetical protein